MRVIAEDLWFPEGPVWVGDGSLLVVEIRRKTLTRIWPNGRKAIVAALGGGPNGAAMGPDGYCYVVNNGGFKFTQRADGRFVTAGTPDDYVTGRIERVNIETGKFEVLYDRIGDTKIRGPNDLVFDAHGGFCFTDPGKTRHRDWDRGSVCYAKADGSLIREMVFPIHKPNGIGLVAGREDALCRRDRVRAALGVGPERHPASSPRPRWPRRRRRTAAGSSTARRTTRASTRSRSRRTATSAVATLDKGGITVCAPGRRHGGVRARRRRHAHHQHLLRRARSDARPTSRCRTPACSSRWTGRARACGSPPRPAHDCTPPGDSMHFLVISTPRADKPSAARDNQKQWWDWINPLVAVRHREARLHQARPRRGRSSSTSIRTRRCTSSSTSGRSACRRRFEVTALLPKEHQEQIAMAGQDPMKL